MALGEIVQSSLKWMDEANCLNSATVFDNYERPGDYAERADKMCLTCPVIKSCFEAGSKGEWGQWGGVFWNGNGEPDSKMNSHKSEEYIQAIERRVIERD